MDFLRHFAIVALLAAGLASSPRGAVAQSLDSEIAGAFGSGWESGYMGLGGGLSKAVGKRARAKPAAAARRLRTATARYEPTPVYFVFETLDHSGVNISRVGLHIPSGGF